MVMDKSDLVTVAVLVPIVSLLAVQLARRLGRWIERALTRTFGETVREVVAPDLARMGTRLGQAVDELRHQNAREHKLTATRLIELDEGVKDIEERLTVLEATLLRPPDARTRATDPPED